MRYIGFVKIGESDRASTKDPLSEIQAAVRSQAYNHWDGSVEAPPQTRQRGEVEASKPSLAVLAWQDSTPVFPDVLLERFPLGCEERKTIEQKREEFETSFPKPPPTAVLPGTVGPSRVGGLCDYSINGGQQPVDVERLVDLPFVKDADFTEERHALLRSLLKHEVMFAVARPAGWLRWQ